MQLQKNVCNTIHYSLHSYCIVKQKNLNRQNGKNVIQWGQWKNNTLTWESYVTL